MGRVASKVSRQGTIVTGRSRARGGCYCKSPPILARPVSGQDGDDPIENGATKPFAAVAKAIGLTKKITPKAMRRSFRDVARAANLPSAIRMGISGHSTDAMDH